MAFILDYDQWIHLDPEDLAETGIGEAYDERRGCQEPFRIDENVKDDIDDFEAEQRR